ncbi:hypothetical protein V5O48_010197 [Marasmius crinis-equi]|uniref:Uncharacterized protein n=1 Tax=Marasmius crinis-equi TaxID=585013 RepID=A0ABR3F911_9AGAR
MDDRTFRGLILAQAPDDINIDDLQLSQFLEAKQSELEPEERCSLVSVERWTDIVEAADPMDQDEQDNENDDDVKTIVDEEEETDANNLRPRLPHLSRTLAQSTSEMNIPSMSPEEVASGRLSTLQLSAGNWALPEPVFVLFTPTRA